MIAQKKSLILVFDTNIFLIGIDFNIINEKVYTTSKIFDEIDVNKYQNKNRNIINKIQAGIDSGKLIIKNPDEKYLKIVRNKSKITGDLRALSEADKSVIALSLELLDNSNQEVVLYTNDYSIQNLCKEMRIRYSSLYKKGIKEKIAFEVYCPICNDIYKAEFLNELCENCGSRLKRKPKR